MTLDANKTLRITYTHHLGNVRATVTDLRQGLWNQGELSSQTSLASAFDYYPFGMIMPGRSFNADKYRFGYGGQETDHETGFQNYKYRMYDSRIARFFAVDPITAQYPMLTPYQHSSLNPIWNIELEGLEGIKYIDTDGVKTIEKNVVVLTVQRKNIPQGATQKQVDKINRQNERIDARNTAKVNDVTTRLNNTFNGSDGQGAKNSAGETVKFKFNVTAIPTNNTNGGTAKQVTKLGVYNGIVSSEKAFDGGPNKVAPAAVVTTRSAGGSRGLSNGVFVTESVGAPESTLSHEVGHTFQLGDNHPSSTGGLMDYPAGGLISSEVDEIWDKSYAK